MISKIYKKGQEEMVGFALIIIIVAVVILILISFSLKKSQKELVESYEVESFIQALSQYTTDCGNYLEPSGVSIQKLIIDCYDGEICLDGRDSCEVLKMRLEGIVESSWKNTPAIGYSLNITAESGEKIFELTSGNQTKNSKGSAQDILKSEIHILFIAYY